MPDPDTPRRVAEQLGHWSAHLSKNAALSWAPYLLGGEACSFCDEDAVGDCLCCGDPCCLAHAHVSYRGELFCDECVDKAVSRKPRKKDKVHTAFTYFSLTQSASLEEVNAIYRLRSKTRHPDQGGEEDDMSLLNQHYEVLKEHFQKKKAA